MKKYIVALTAICTLFFSACTSQLDIPQKGVVAYETYYTSDEAAEAALVNVYAKMVQNVYGSVGNWNPYFFMMNYSADDVFNSKAKPQGLKNTSYPVIVLAIPVVKNPPANVGDTGDSDLIPGLGRSPGEGNDNHSSILVWEMS